MILILRKYKIMKRQEEIDNNFNRVANKIGNVDGPLKYIGHFMNDLYEYGKLCEGGHIVEIGVQGLLSSWAWLKSNPKKITLNDISFNPCREILPIYKSIAEENNIEVVVEEMNSHRMELADVDLLFIDGLHQRPHVRKELELFNEVVSKYIIVHDIMKFKGVKDATDDFLSTTDEWVLDKDIEIFPGLRILKRIN